MGTVQVKVETDVHLELSKLRDEHKLGSLSRTIRLLLNGGLVVDL